VRYDSTVLLNDRRPSFGEEEPIPIFSCAVPPFSPPPSSSPMELRLCDPAFVDSAAFSGPLGAH